MEDRIIKIFISYSHDDSSLMEVLKNNLEGHLIQHHNYQFQIWDDHAIRLGQYWKPTIYKAIEESSVFLLLISVAFAKSEFCTKIELEEFKKKCDAKQAIIVPILLRSFNFKHLGISDIQGFNPIYSDYGRKKSKKIMPFDEIVEPKPIEKYIQQYCKDLSEKINDAVVKSKIIPKIKTNSVLKGKILHNIPDEMELDRPIPCKIKIAFNEKLLRKDIEDSKEISKVLEIGTKMAVSLKALESSDFKIEKLSPENQEVVKHAATEWNFSVTPKIIGIRSLFLEAHVVNDAGERVTIGYNENIKVLSILDHNSNQGFKDTGKTIVAYFPLNWEFNNPKNEPVEDPSSPPGHIDIPKILPIRLLKYLIPIAITVGGIYYLVNNDTSKAKTSITIINTQDTTKQIVSDVKIIDTPEIKVDNPIIPVDPIREKKKEKKSSSPVQTPLPVHITPKTDTPIVINSKPEPILYKIKINSAIDFPLVYVNNQLTPCIRENGNRYIKIEGGEIQILLFDSLNKYSCDRINILIERNETIKFTCKARESKLVLQLKDEQLRGNTFYRYKYFSIDGQPFDINVYYDGKGNLTILNLPFGKHIFSIPDVKCKYPFEFKIGTSLIGIKCF